MSATTALCGWCLEAIVARFVDLRHGRQGERRAMVKAGGDVPVGGDDVEVRVDGEVLAIAAADVKADSAVGKGVQEALDDWPRLPEVR